LAEALQVGVTLMQANADGEPGTVLGVVENGCRVPRGTHQPVEILLTGRTPLLNAVR